MKKYLIKGALALFAGILLLSCAEKESEYVPTNVQKARAFEDVFKEVYGEIDPYQNWGFTNQIVLADESTSEVVYVDSIMSEPYDPFATRARTRATGEFANHVGAYPDANMWTSKGFLAPPPLTKSQKLRAQYYFQMNRITNPNRPNYGTKDFFMQQVYDGGDDPMSGKSPEVYKAADNNTLIQSGEHMDHLTCGPDHTHTYNFNNGNCSTNSNVANRDQTDVNNTSQQHSDQIQLLLNTKTSCFGYANSDASCVRDDRWTLVSAATIDNFCDNDSGFAVWLSTRLGGEEDVKCDDEYHRSYIGFDFDMLPDESIFAGTAQYEYGLPEYNYQPHYIGKTYSQYDYYRYDLYGAKYHYLSANSNQYCGTSRLIDPEPNDAEALVLLNDGWLPATGSANKTWIKVGGCADGYYSDWIVTFMPADSEPTPDIKKKKTLVESQSGRIFCEDLGVSSREDLDFNDVVFDVYVYKHEILTTIGSNTTVTEDDPLYTCEIILQAAGGTISLTVANRDVHDVFKVGLTTMVNTRDDNTTAYGQFADRDEVSLGVFTPTQLFPNSTKYTSDRVCIEALDIPVCVNYGKSEVNVLGSKLGGAPAKIFVPNHDTKWTVERKPLSLAYPKFAEYVGSKDVKWWNDPGLTDTEKQRAGYYRHGNGVSSSSTSRPPIVVTRLIYPESTEHSIWTGSQPYETWTLKDLTLTHDTFYAGDRIRFYASNLQDDSYITVVYSDNSKPYFVDAPFPNYKTDSKGNLVLDSQGKKIPVTAGVIEVMLDEDNAKQMTKTVQQTHTIQVQGRHMTLTKISRVPFK